MADALPFIALASSAVGAVGQIKTGQMQQDAYAYNATVARQQGDTAVDQANVNAQQQDITNRRNLGAQQAAVAGSGVEGTSPLAVMMDQATMGETARQLALYRGKVQANAAVSQANIDTFYGQAAANAGETRAAGTLLTGFTNFGNTKQGEALLNSASKSLGFG